ncbi:hypothetical protein NJC40_15175 [Pseudomonas sp. 21LCFQ02]|uniref:hypothetical protein n=1 Tax=unclassified Pseudomonas TaxID=196821 RepID=UPI00209711BC|nr:MULTISPECIES: hypothetical protein [unclassified Pseudomonas]MCO8161141.1 hypothetical protein [Pseudomonas sp. 21LCFQ010]MCO8169112.1 hypothetical protein [Pseudomonas sp. 21LCFQ02]
MQQLARGFVSAMPQMAQNAVLSRFISLKINKLKIYKSWYVRCSPSGATNGNRLTDEGYKRASQQRDV